MLHPYFYFFIYTESIFYLFAKKSWLPMLFLDYSNIHSKYVKFPNSSKHSFTQFLKCFCSFYITWINILLRFYCSFWYHAVHKYSINCSSVFNETELFWSYFRFNSAAQPCDHIVKTMQIYFINLDVMIILQDILPMEYMYTQDNIPYFILEIKKKIQFRNDI